MALRDQPYLPLYIQDFLTDEKLSECSAESTGVYIRLMCLLHKSDPYGKILLKQKYKQSDKQILNFASQVAKNLPYDLPTVQRSLTELFAEGVIQIEGDFLYQKRMVNDGEISDKRAAAGGKGGKKTQLNNKTFASKFAKAKSKANTEYEYEYEYDNEDVNSNKKKRTKSKFVPPEEKEVIAYFDEKGYSDQAARRAFEYYNTSGWIDSQGKKVKNWKQKMLSIWFKPENLKQNGQQTATGGGSQHLSKQQQRQLAKQEYYNRGRNIVGGTENSGGLFGNGD